jgi:hypothetical protein
MAFGKTVGAEPFQLPEGALGKCRVITVVDHALDQLVAEFVDAAGVLERRHRPAELIGFGRRKAGRHHRDLHRLFLKEGHPECFAKHFLELGLGKDHRLPSFAAAQIGMHHVALNGSWPHCALRLIATTRYDGLRPPATIDRDHPFRAIATSLWTGVMEAVG